MDYTPQLTDCVNLLNHGTLRLVDHMGNDLSVVRSARVSYDAEFRTGDDADKDARLLDYLVRNMHTSPLESVNFTFEVKAPIFVFRQWHRHRTWKFNEISARYSELPEEFYVPDADQITTQHSSNKQMRTDDKNPQADIIRIAMEVQCRDAFTLYRRLLAMGTPRELARSILPVGTYSRMFATIDLHNLMKFCKLRIHPHAQYEIRVYAEAMLAFARLVCPITVAAVEKHWLTA